MSEDEEPRCRCGGRRLENGNCGIQADDGLPCQCVGVWAARKHDRLRLYIEATRAVRAKYLAPKGAGGAAFIDLFAGPGRARLRDEQRLVQGSPLIALEHTAAPFTRVLLCDMDPANVDALRARTRGHTGAVEFFEGDCNSEIDRIVMKIPPFGLNIAFIDPFGPRALKWTTIAKLGAFKRMDLLIHFPTGPIKRNFLHAGFDAVVDEMVGTPRWRAEVLAAEQVPKLIDYLRESLVTLGYQADRVRSLAVTNEKNVPLYHLVFASKNPRGSAIWTSITQHDGAQRGLPL